MKLFTALEKAQMKGMDGMKASWGHIKFLAVLKPRRRLEEVVSCRVLVKPQRVMGGELACQSATPRARGGGGAGGPYLG